MGSTAVDFKSKAKPAPVVRGAFATVRWLYERHSMNETALCFRGAKFGNCVVIDYPIRVYTMNLRDMDKLRPVEFKGGDYPIAKAVALFRATQDKNGITRGADRLLRMIETGWQEMDPQALDVSPSEESMHIIRPPVTVNGEPVDYDPADFAKNKILGDDNGTRKRKGPGERFNDQLKKPQSEDRRPVTDKEFMERCDKTLVPGSKSDGNPAQAKRGTILGAICAELGIDPADARKRLRGAGMRAPYDNEAAIRGALK